MPVLAWDSPFASESSSATGGESGSNRTSKVPNSYLLFQRDRASDPKRRAVVVAEDNSGDVFLVKEAVAEAKLDVDLYFLIDGEEALRFFAQVDEQAVRVPDLLLLDLNLPGANGFQVLSSLRGSKRCAGMRVVVMTSSSARADQEKSASFGIDLFFTKPGTYDEFLTLGDIIRKLI
jgi:CheY-like chemotaxis protein